MKKTYQKPQTKAIPLAGPVLMLGGSNSVNTYRQGTDIFIGDDDEDDEYNN